MEALSEKRGRHRRAGGAAESADHHGQHGGHHHARAAGAEHRGRGGPVRPAHVAAVLVLLGLCGRRHAVLRPVFRREGRRRHQPLLRHDADLHDDRGNRVRRGGAAVSGGSHARLHRQDLHSGNRRALSAGGGLRLSPSGAVHGHERAAALHRQGAHSAVRRDCVRLHQHRAELGADLRPSRPARPGHSGRGPRPSPPA